MHTYKYYYDGRGEMIDGKQFTVDDATCQSIVASNVNESNYTFNVSASGIVCPSGISRLQFAV